MGFVSGVELVELEGLEADAEVAGPEGLEYAAVPGWSSGELEKPSALFEAAEALESAEEL